MVSGPKQFRESIARETRRFAEELTDDLSSPEQMKRQPLANIPEVAEMMVMLVFSQGVMSLDMSETERKNLVRKLNIELRMVLAGSHAVYLKKNSKK